MALTLSPEDITAIAEALKGHVVEEANKAAAAHVTNRNKSFEEKLDQKLSNLVKPVIQEDEPAEKQTLTVRLNKQDETIKGLLKQLKDEKTSNQRANMRSATESVLLKGKVSQDLLKAAVAQLMHEDKLIELDEQTGNAYFKSNSNGYEEKLPLEDGVNGWLKTSGKAFIASPKAQGAGIRDVRSSNSAQSQDTLTQEEHQSAVVEMIRALR
ncbi:MAG TPA: hypothetical protein VII94_00175 [Candidatus Saccharimonadales bacterium]